MVTASRSGGCQESRLSRAGQGSAQACQELETVLAYYEQQPGVPVSTTVILSGPMMQAAKKKTSQMQQKQITNFFHA